MKRFAIFVAVLAFLCTSFIQAQTQQITGSVTSSDDGLGVPGASIVVKGTTFGTITDFDGNYTLNAPAGATALLFSFVGMKTQDISIDGRSTIDVVLAPDMFGLDEVIVSGMASGTPQKKLSVTVGKVSEKELKEVPATSPGAALQGKLAGVTVVSATGNPGSAPAIRLRGSTSLLGSQAPLIILDGVMIEGTLADVNIDDIESIEVVKGAAASALYGSRAGSGVIVINSKRGKGLAKGQTLVTIRNEYGQSSLAKKVDYAKHHPYKLKDGTTEDRWTDYLGVTYYAGTNPDSIGIALSGNRVIEEDHYADNPFGVLYDNQELFYTTGSFYTNYISVQNNQENTNFMASFENSKQEGIIFSTGGYERQNFRLNVDHWFTDKFGISVSNLIAKSFTDNPQVGFMSLQLLPPDSDLKAKNPDGSPYRLIASVWSSDDTNPLYGAYNAVSESSRNRVLGSYEVKYNPTDWLRFNANYAFERQDNRGSYYEPKGFLTRPTVDSGGSDGYLSKTYGHELAYTIQFTANFNKMFGDFTTKAKISYLYENDHWEGFNANGREFSVGGVPDLNVTIGDKNVGSYTGDIRAENIFGIVDVDYKEKYIFSGLYRYDGASQFGSNERWNPYFRVSAAYRLTEDVTIPGVQELKIRAAYGTSGERPPWDARYETYSVSAGSVSKVRLGNENLKPSTVKELELGLNVEFMNRFEFEFTYSHTDATDVFAPAPFPASAGWTEQWRNIGTLTSTVFEAALTGQLVQGDNLNWTSTLLFDRIRQEVTKLDIPAFTTGPGPNSIPSYRIEEGYTYGINFGDEFLRSLDELAKQLGTEDNINDYTINSDGYVILKGTEGTIYEKPVKRADSEYGLVKKVPIGDANPDFNLRWSNTLTYKGFSLYALMDWKQGGDVYNMTRHWAYRDNRGAEMDQYGKPANEKKTIDYYQTLYNVASVNSHFVEDATYLKIREIALYYSLGRSNLSGFLNGFFKSIRIGVTGRNLFTFTNYSGYDPEVANGGEATNQFYDSYNYPNFRTYTGSLEFTF
jgi:TonB-linked SusC/RagA family outer membrane protein